MTTTAQAPTLLSGIRAVMRLQWLRLRRGRRLRLASVATGLVVFAVLASIYAAGFDSPKIIVQRSLQTGFFWLLVFLVPFLFSSGAIAEEIENETLPYVTSRPVGRTSLAIGKYITGTGLALILLISAVLIVHVGAYATVPSAMVGQLSSTLQALGALCLLTSLYSAACLFWGAVAPEASGILSALYLVVVEFAFGLMPGVFRVVSMNYLGNELAGLPRRGLMAEYAPDVSPVVAILVILVEIGVLVALTVAVVRGSQFRYGTS